MQPSAEIENLILQLYEKLTSGGILAFVKSLYSHRDGVFVIGSDPKEWLEDYESIMHLYEENDIGLKIKVSELKAYCEDTVGWAMDRVMVKLLNGKEVPVRHTYIFCKENDAWKLVHAHISVGVSNESIGA